MKHKPEDCKFKGVCEDNGYEPPYCNECEVEEGAEQKNNEVK